MKDPDMKFSGLEKGSTLFPINDERKPKKKPEAGIGYLIWESKMEIAKIYYLDHIKKMMTFFQENGLDVNRVNKKIRRAWFVEILKNLAANHTLLKEFDLARVYFSFLNEHCEDDLLIEFLNTLHEKYLQEIITVNNSEDISIRNGEMILWLAMVANDLNKV